MDYVSELSNYIHMSEKEIINNIDNQMIPILYELNRKGYKTIYCCQGHTTNKYDVNIYIAFEEKNINFGIEFPKYKNKKVKVKIWNPKKYSSFQHTVIECNIDKSLDFDEKERIRRELIRNIHDWALSLEVR